MKKQAKEWLKFAKIDLQSSETLIEDESLSTSAAFHVQQCVEKSLKALLELYNEKVPRVHDLIKLKKQVEEIDTKNIKINEEIIDQINQVYIDTRYPADFGLLPDGNPSKERIVKFIEEAKSIYEQTEKTILEYKEK